MSTKPPAAIIAIAGVLLAVYLTIAVRALASPSNDPQRGMAIGFLVPVTLFLASLALVLWYGATHSRPGMVWTVFIITALPSLSLVGRAIYLLLRWLKKA